MTPREKIDRVLQGWDTVIKYLKDLTPEEVLLALKHEKARAGGPRYNILFRLAQRYDAATKGERIKKLLAQA